MKKIILVLLAVFMVQTSLFADELMNAYNKEFAYLKAQKEELQKRLESEKKTHDAEIQSATLKVQKLQDRYVALSEELQTVEKKTEKANEQLSDKTNNKDMLENLVLQVSAALAEYGVASDESTTTTHVQKLEKSFAEAIALYKKLSSIQTMKGSFFLSDGTTQEAEIVKVGNIAAYGISTKASGALAPAGNGDLKLWNTSSSASARALHEGKMTKDLDIFLYENLDKEVEYVKEKTIGQTLEGGGLIGNVILGLGALGALLLLLRVFFLLNAGSNVTKITNIVVQKVESGHKHEALSAIESFKGSTARVIRSALRNIDRDRQHIEDIVTEAILNESNSLDRFGNFILVLAAVAPLMGLLGTVTGMIATFDVITEHGTGDPKMLSGGISEALVTTMEGLIVAIPLLLVGNLLSGWARSIKDSMEQSALHIVNLYMKHR